MEYMREVTYLSGALERNPCFEGFEEMVLTLEGYVCRAPFSVGTGKDTASIALYLLLCVWCAVYSTTSREDGLAGHLPSLWCYTQHTRHKETG